MMLEWRNRLWGMTVAPNMPIALNNISAFMIISVLGMKPAATLTHLGFNTANL